MVKFQPRRSFLLGTISCGLLLASCAFGQTVSSLVPSSVAAGSGGFVLTVFGANFSSGSVVQLRTASGVVQTLPSYLINRGLVMAVVSGIDVETPANLQVGVADYSAQSVSNLVTLAVTGSGTTSSSSGSSSSGSGSGSGSSSSSGSGSSSSGSGSSSGSTSSGSGGASSCYECYSLTSGGSSSAGSGSGSGSSSGSGSGSSSGTASSGPSATSPAGSSLLVTVTSPRSGQSVDGSATIVATAAQTANTDGSVFSWAIYDGNNLLWVDENPDTSINVDLALSQGLHSLRVVAYDDSFQPSTATVSVSSTSSGQAIVWHACLYTRGGVQYQAMQISPTQTVTGVLQSQMFYGSNCSPTQWTDQLNDVGQTMTFGAGSGYLFWFIHRPDTPGVSAVWTMGNQSSGCVNYSTAPACN